MKVAVLVNKANCDRYTAQGAIPADWELAYLGNGTPDEDKIIATNADALLVDSMMPISQKVINGLKNLKLIQAQGVGYNFVDLEAAKNAGVYVANSAGANASAVAEQVVLLMLSVLRNVIENNNMVFEGKQIEAKTRCFEIGLKELGDCHVGLVGFGAIGRETAKRLEAFGCRISYFDIFEAKGVNYPRLSLDEIYAECDIISLHVPVTSETTNMINDETINKMKKGVIIINTARGEIVDQEALCRALIDGRVGGAGLDTLSPEPVQADNPILQLPADARHKVVLSPHIAGITAGSFNRFYNIAWGNIRKVSAGERPINVVNGL